MAKDKQLSGVSLSEVVRKRDLDQALSAKEFAVLAGISYSTARAWFRLQDFPVVCGVVFWRDFVKWRTAKAGLNPSNSESLNRNMQGAAVPQSPGVVSWPPRAARILSEFE